MCSFTTLIEEPREWTYWEIHHLMTREPKKNIVYKPKNYCPILPKTCRNSPHTALANKCKNFCRLPTKNPLVCGAPLHVIRTGKKNLLNCTEIKMRNASQQYSHVNRIIITKFNAALQSIGTYMLKKPRCEISQAA